MYLLRPPDTSVTASGIIEKACRARRQVEQTCKNKLGEIGRDGKSRMHCWRIEWKFENTSSNSKDIFVNH